MNSNQIECFVESAKRMSFTSAATALFLSPQAVSKQVIALEEDLGIRLFERNGPHLSLTEGGKLFYSLFIGLSRQLNITTEDISQYIRGQKLALSIGMSEWLDPAGSFMDGVSRFREQYPGCKVSISTYQNTALQDALNEAVVDCAIFSGSQIPQGAEYESLIIATEDVLLFAPGDTGTGKARADCWGLPLLRVSPWDRSNAELRLSDAREISGIALTPTAVYRLPNVQSLHAQMEYGRGATLGGSKFSYFLKVPKLTGHPIGETDDIHCLWRRRNRNSLAQAFASTLRDFFSL